jgi:LysM repeat protein
MNKEAPYREKAEKMRKKIERNESSSSKERELPSRNKVHGQKRQKNKWKVKYPIIRLLVLVFILLPISIFSAYSYLNSLSKGNGVSSIRSSGGYEIISLEKDGEQPATGQPKHTLSSDDGKDVQIEKPLEPIEPTQLSGDVVSSAIEGKEEQAAVSSPTIGKGADNGNQEILPDPIKKGKIHYHTVQHGENLFRISLKYYHSQNGIEYIRKANNIQDDEVQAGQVLKIPLKD